MAKITLHDVAKRADVSAMTVSRVINSKPVSEATRQRVQRVIDELGYRPNRLARGLITRRSWTLGLMLPDITNPFFPEIVRGAEEVAWEHGYSVVLCNTGEDLNREAGILRVLEDTQVDGVLLCSARQSEEQLLALIRKHAAAVVVNRRISDKYAGSVEVDDIYGSRLAVRHLLSRGRRRIAFLAGPRESYSGRKRLRGYTLELRQSGRRVRSELIVQCPPAEEGGYQAARALLASRRIDGLVSYNDLVAIGALQACAELGVRVPEDVAVVGFDNIRMASLVMPSLTTLEVPKFRLGASAARMLLNRIQGKLQPSYVVFKPELVIRASAP